MHRLSSESMCLDQGGESSRWRATSSLPPVPKTVARRPARSASQQIRAKTRQSIPRHSPRSTCRGKGIDSSQLPPMRASTWSQDMAVSQRQFSKSSTRSGLSEGSATESRRQTHTAAYRGSTPNTDRTPSAESSWRLSQQIIRRPIEDATNPWRLMHLHVELQARRAPSSSPAPSKSSAELNNEFQQVFENMEPAPAKKSPLRARFLKTAYSDLVMNSDKRMEAQPPEPVDREVAHGRRLHALTNGKMLIGCEDLSLDGCPREIRFDTHEAPKPLKPLKVGAQSVL